MKKAFNAKAMERLKNIVGNWKAKWRYQGGAAKPTYVSDKTWTDLKAYWLLPRNIRTSNNCSAAWLMPDVEGNLPLPHTSGQIPHALVVIKMVSINYFFFFV